MLLEYGHVMISYDGVDYTLTPSFSNIAKLGKPKEIISKFKRFVSLDNNLAKWHLSMDVLECCCDKELPIKLVGSTVFSEKKQRFIYMQPAHGMPMFNDCITLAEHCLRHGVCGVCDSHDDVDYDSEPVSEFDAYKFIEIAMEHLNASRSDASTKTMTEFSRRMALKFPSQKKKNEPVISDFDRLINWGEQQDKGH